MKKNKLLLILFIVFILSLNITNAYDYKGKTFIVKYHPKYCGWWTSGAIYINEGCIKRHNGTYKEILLHEYAHDWCYKIEGNPDTKHGACFKTMKEKLEHDNP